MLTDPRDAAAADALSTRHGHSCFFDSDMIDTVLHGDASLANAEGSQLAGSDALSAEPSLGTPRSAAGVVLAQGARGVHARARGYPAVFLDASDGGARGPARARRERLARAELVTLADFGGAKEQQAINTGVVAAAPDSFAGDDG